MEIHELVEKVTKLSEDKRFTSEEQNIMFAAAVRLATYNKLINDIQDRTKRLYQELTKEKQVQ